MLNYTYIKFSIYCILVVDVYLTGIVDSKPRLWYMLLGWGGLVSVICEGQIVYLI